MGKLIYADDLKKEIDMYKQSLTYHDCLDEIKRAPAVEAIPIEWINRYLLSYLYLDNERLPDDEVDDGYYYIQTMVSDWKKEKENDKI